MERKGSQLGRSLRWAFIGVVVAGLIAVAAGLALPFAISTDLVRDRLERDISDWTGHQVELLDTPNIGFWPVPYIELNRISISSRQDPDADPIVYADEMRVDFSILSALSGEPSFSNFVLVRPVFTVDQYPDGSTSWSSRVGRISEGIALAVEAAEADGQQAGTASSVPADRLGELSIENGTFEWIDRDSGRQEKATALNGTVSWPRLNGALRADMSGIFRGEAVDLNVSTTEPLLLLAGQSAPARTNLTSAALTMSFDGMANLSAKPFFAGALTMESPSMRQTLQWTGADIKPGEAIGALDLAADIQVQNGRAMLNDVILELEGNRGIGVLDFRATDEGIPYISGTLAFNSLDIASFLRAFTPLPQSGKEIAETIDTSFLRQLSLDMRLSSQTATLGQLDLTSLAAAAQIVDGRAVFDIGDAQAYGGTMSGRIRIAEDGAQGGGMLNFSARNIDISAVLAALEIDGPLPQGTATLNIALSSPYPSWATGLSDLDGKFDIAIVDGTIPSFDLGQFRELAASRRFFGMGGVANGSFAFTSAVFKTTFANGLAEINEGKITGDDAVIDLTGIIPYQRGGLALIGLITDNPGEAAPDNEGDTAAASQTQDDAIRFFVGGTWQTPVISPILGN